VDYGEDQAVDHVADRGSHSLLVGARRLLGLLWCFRLAWSWEIWFEHPFAFLGGQLAAMLIAAGVEGSSLLGGDDHGEVLEGAKVQLREFKGPRWS